MRLFSTVDFGDTFQRRAAEWLLASYMTIWGLVLLHDSSLFDSLSPVYAQMARTATEDTWGIFLYLIGAFRMVFLTVNGMWRPMAHARTGLSILAAVAWVLIAFEMLGTRQPSAQAWGCLTFVFFDLWNASRASIDAARADNRARADGR